MILGTMDGPLGLVPSGASGCQVGDSSSDSAQRLTFALVSDRYLDG